MLRCRRVRRSTLSRAWASRLRRSRAELEGHRPNVLRGVAHGHLLRRLDNRRIMFCLASGEACRGWPARPVRFRRLLRRARRRAARGAVPDGARGRVRVPPEPEQDLQSAADLVGRASTTGVENECHLGVLAFALVPACTPTTQPPPRTTPMQLFAAEGVGTRPRRWSRPGRRGAHRGERVARRVPGSSAGEGEVAAEIIDAIEGHHGWRRRHRPLASLHAHLLHRRQWQGRASRRPYLAAERHQGHQRGPHAAGYPESPICESTLPTPADLFGDGRRTDLRRLRRSRPRPDRPDRPRRGRPLRGVPRDPAAPTGRRLPTVLAHYNVLEAAVSDPQIVFGFLGDDVRRLLRPG